MTFSKEQKSRDVIKDTTQSLRYDDFRVSGSPKAKIIIEKVASMKYTNEDRKESNESLGKINHK